MQTKNENRTIKKMRKFILRSSVRHHSKTSIDNSSFHSTLGEPLNILAINKGNEN